MKKQIMADYVRDHIKPRKIKGTCEGHKTSQHCQLRRFYNKGSPNLSSANNSNLIGLKDKVSMF